jgi:hypothetical protein
VLPAELPHLAVPTVELGTRRPVAVAPDPAPDQPGVAAPVVAAPAVARPAEPEWLPVQGRIEEADRDRLRTALGWKFQAHTRAVARTMSLHPGLRGAVGAHEAVAGLVAVLALLDGDGRRVNDVLRGGGTPDEDVQLLARCASAGLAQLPAVTGAVFCAVPAGLDVARLYRAGEVLVEPAFTEVATGHGTDGAGPWYAIWSATARRLDQLRTAEESGRAMFAAGTRFAVLGVEESYVLLRELVFDRRDIGLDERAAGKLRTAVGAHPDQAGPPCLPWPLGFDADGRRFAARPHVEEGAR